MVGITKVLFSSGISYLVSFSSHGFFGHSSSFAFIHDEFSHHKILFCEFLGVQPHDNISAGLFSDFTCLHCELAVASCIRRADSMSDKRFTSKRWSIYNTIDE